MARRSIIKEICDVRGVRYEWLARQIGINQYRFSRIEAGSEVPPRDYYDRVARVLLVPVDLLRPPDPEPEPEPEAVTV